MSFFEPPPPPPALPEEPPQPEWIGPPDNILGAPVPLELLVVRTEGVAVVVRNVVAYPNGINFVLDVRRRKAAIWDDPLGMHPHGGDTDARATALRFGIGLSDGSKATVEGPRPWPQGDDVRGPILISRGGGGGGTRWEMGYWLWPLPPAGPVAFVAEWRAEGIDETRVEVDAAVLRDAAGRAERLWDENPHASAGGQATMLLAIGQDERPESD